MRCLRVGDGVVGDRARHVEDAVAAGDGRRQAAAVQQVGPEQPQPLAGAVQRRQLLRVLVHQVRELAQDAASLLAHAHQFWSDSELH